MHRYMDMINNIDPYLLQDLEQISNSNLPYERFRNKTVLITGATGLIGFSTIRALTYINLKCNLGLHILAVVRDIEKARKTFKSLCELDFISFIVCDLSNPIVCEEKVSYVIHCAGETKSKRMISQPVETIESIVLSTSNVLKMCTRLGVESVVYLSSMEMYGVFNKEKEVDENTLGYVDPLSLRSNYPESKRLCENMCVAYYSEYKVPVKIARLAQTFGAGVLPGESRIFYQFANSVIEKRDIILHTKGKAQGNYCYLSETILGIFTILFCGEDGQAYNISNEKNHCTIGEMAQLVIDNFGNDSTKVKFEIPPDNAYGYAKETKMRLSSKKLRSLGWIPTIDLVESYRRMIGSMTYFPGD